MRRPLTYDESGPQRQARLRGDRSVFIPQKGHRTATIIARRARHNELMIKQANDKQARIAEAMQQESSDELEITTV